MLHYYSYRLERPRRKPGVIVVSAFMVLTFHSILLAPFFLTSASSHARVPARQGVGASASVSTTTPVMTLVIINTPDSSPNISSKSFERELASRGFASRNPLAAITSPDSAPAIRLPDTQLKQIPAVTADDAEDTTERAVQFGHYIGQIKTRIESAWSRPRTVIGADTFSCVARIEQDRRGTVLNVVLEQCNGDERWQVSLVRAIQSASPLPASSDSSVFTNAIELRFVAEPYQEGQNDDGYEPALFAGRTPASDNGTTQISEFHAKLHDTLHEAGQVISLRLQGSSVESSALATVESQSPFVIPSLGAPQRTPEDATTP